MGSSMSWEVGMARTGSVLLRFTLLLITDPQDLFLENVRILGY